MAFPDATAPNWLKKWTVAYSQALDEKPGRFAGSIGTIVVCSTIGAKILKSGDHKAPMRWLRSLVGGVLGALVGVGVHYGILHLMDSGAGDRLKDQASDLLDWGKAAVNRQKDTLEDAVEAGRQAYRDAVE